MTGLDYRAPGGLLVEGWVNGELRQSASTSALIFSIDYLIAFVSAVMTLLPGDIIITGTPAGVGPLKAGDSVTVQIGGVGELTNPVRERPILTAATGVVKPAATGGVISQPPQAA